MLTFKQYLAERSELSEDAAQEVSKLSSDLAMIDAQIAQRTQPLIARKNQIQKQLAVKRKQADVEAKRNPSLQAQPQPNTPPAQQPGGATPQQPQ